MKKVIFFLIIASLLISCNDINSIRSPQKSIKKVGRVVTVEGRWKAINKIQPRAIISKINFTSITCDSSDLMCREVESLVFTPKEEPLIKQSLLYSQEFTYRITDWDNGVIKAKREAPVADIEIIISLKDNFAEKSFRETRARGSETADSNIYGKWILE